MPAVVVVTRVGEGIHGGNLVRFEMFGIWLLTSRLDFFLFNTGTVLFLRIFYKNQKIKNVECGLVSVSRKQLIA